MQMNSTKPCSSCRTEFSVSDYRIVNSRIGKRASRCEACLKAYASAWYQKNRELTLQRSKARVERKRDEIRAYLAEYQRNNSTRLKQYHRDWCVENADRVKEKYLAEYPAKREQFIARARKRQAAEIKATTNWNPEFDQLVFEEAYSLCALRKSLTGHSWHVDHIMPLRGKTVCGLHSYTNIAVIQASINRAKSNKHWPDMPTE